MMGIHRNGSRSMRMRQRSWDTDVLNQSTRRLRPACVDNNPFVCIVHARCGLWVAPRLRSAVRTMPSNAYKIPSRPADGHTKLAPHKCLAPPPLRHHQSQQHICATNSHGNRYEEITKNSASFISGSFFRPEPRALAAFHATLCPSSMWL